MIPSQALKNLLFTGGANSEVTVLISDVLFILCLNKDPSLSGYGIEPWNGIFTYHSYFHHWFLLWPSLSEGIHGIIGIRLIHMF